MVYLFEEKLMLILILRVDVKKISRKDDFVLTEFFWLRVESILTCIIDWHS